MRVLGRKRWAAEMTMINKAFAAVIATLVLSGAVAAADTRAPQPGEARYEFHKVADGFLRLDTQSGEVALCTPRAVGWACLTAPEDRAALEDEIARLRKDNAALKQALLAHGLALPPGTMPEPKADDDNGKSQTIRLPDDGDFDRLMAFVGAMWHRLAEAIANAQNQLLHKS
jgi:hypothetical protein